MTTENTCPCGMDFDTQEELVTHVKATHKKHVTGGMS